MRGEGADAPKLINVGGFLRGGCGDAFSDAAEGLGFYAYVGGDVVLRDALLNVVVVFEEFQVAFSGRVGVKGFDLADGAGVEGLDAETTEFFSFFYFIIELLEIGVGDGEEGGRLEALDTFFGRGAVEEADKVADELAFAGKVIGDFFAFVVEKVTDKAVVDIIEVFTGNAGLKEKVAFFQVFDTEKGRDEGGLFSGEGNIGLDGMEEAGMGHFYKDGNNFDKNC